MFQQLCHAVAYWDKQLRDKSPASMIDTETVTLSSSVGALGDGDTYFDISHFESTTSNHIPPSIRRMTVPSIHVLQYDTPQVVTLDRSFGTKCIRIFKIFNCCYKDRLHNFKAL